MSDYDSLIDFVLSDSEHSQQPKEHSIPEQFRQFADEMPGGFFIYRAEGDEEVLFANRSMLRIFNCTSMDEFLEYIGHSFRGIVHPDDLEQVELSIVQQITASQYDLDYVEYRIIQKGGDVRWIEDYGHFVQSEHLGPIFYVFISDATEKHKSSLAEREALLNQEICKERRLLQRLENYRRDLENMNRQTVRHRDMIEGLSVDYDSIFYVDLDENLLCPYRVSDRIENEIHLDQNYPFESFNDAYIQRWVHPDDQDMLASVCQPDYIRSHLEKDGSFHFNYRILKGGMVEYLQMRVVNVGEQQKVSQVVLGYRSVDEEIRAEIAQRKMLESAFLRERASSAAKTAFLANMSHDIRTPMNAIMGFTALSKAHLDDRDKISHYLDCIQNSGGQLLHLLNDVLEYSNLSAGDLRLEEKNTDLVQLAEEIQKDFREAALAKGIQLSVKMSYVRHTHVICDGTVLRQIMQRLVDNAVKYTPNGGQVTICITEFPNSRGNYAFYWFTVEDTGIGISENMLEHIFEPFERERNTTLSGVQGAGLGLAIVKALVERMGGGIEAYSAIGKGSHFTATLNLRLMGTEQQNEAPPSQEETLHHYKILLVEDNEINREIETELLEDNGCSVTTAADGLEAVKKMEASQPGDFDLILMDLQMPVMDGFQAARSIRGLADPQLASIPMIAVSANAFESDQKNALASGMNAHLSKPIDLDVLMKTIENVMKK